MHTVPILIDRLAPGGIGIPGVTDLEKLISPGLTIVDDNGSLRPLLAEAAPSIENGQWQVFPDGRMETTWRIRPNARWHDGTPFTSADAVFTQRVERDNEVPMRRMISGSLVESVEAPDAHTVTVKWARRFIEADGLFGVPFFPKHLLEKSYEEDRAAFLQLPYFTEEFVGIGPFKLRQFVRDSYLLLEANDHYVLGRPKIDEIEVRFISDFNAVTANLLAGGVELTLGRGISLENALQLRDIWQDGGIDIAFTSWVVIFPQFLNPSPAAIGDVRLRRALMHAMDRQQMADSLQAGLVPVADTFLHPREPEYKEIESSIVRHDYDPRRAVQLIEGMGYSRGTDGTFVDSAGQRLAVEIRTSGADVTAKAIFVVADDWKAVGVATDPMIMPEQRRVPDREWVQTFPGFLSYRQPNAPNEWLLRLHSNQTPLPENNFVGRNHPRYMNPEFDALIDRFYTTIPRQERTQVLGQLINHTTDLLTTMGLFYDVEPILVGKRLRNVAAQRANGSTPVWNADQWDVL
jgi:peptide/nickel transport system substrate-binding protein